MEQKDKIEIPLGAFNSELDGWEYTIPDGYEAEIKYGKVIVRKAEGEDEKIRKEILDFFHQFENGELRGVDISSWIAWLEKQDEQKPMEEHDFIKIASGSYSLSFINYLDAHLYEGKMCVSNGECEDIENAFRNADWGKIGRYYNKFTQKPVVWNDEDEKIIIRIICLFECDYGKNSSSKFAGIKVKDIVDWLKSLKDRCCSQKQWKPTEEQMDALYHVSKGLVCGESDCEALYTLYEQLKEL